MKRKMFATDCSALLKETDTALESLSPHEELILRLRFGIGGKRQSIHVIARHLGLRPEDLETLEARALTRLRRIAVAADHNRPAG